MTGTAPAVDSLHSFLRKLQQGDTQHFGNLAMTPLLNPGCADQKHLTLHEALATGQFTITEVHAGGSVPNLKVINLLDRQVLLLDGEELVGAKQNRIVNTTILVKEASDTVIPVSCCEQGRWSYERPDFTSEHRVMSADMRSSKSRQVMYRLNAHNGFSADQHAIWDEIQAKAGRRSAESRSMAMKAIFEKEKNAIEDYRGNFAAIPDQVGALFLINGYIAGLDCFGGADMFQRQFTKLLDSYALDAIDRMGQPTTKTSGCDKAVWMAYEILQAEASCRPSVSLGIDVRFENYKVHGFALIHDHVPVHVCAFRNRHDTHAYGGNRLRRRYHV